MMKRKVRSKVLYPSLTVPLLPITVRNVSSTHYQNATRFFQSKDLGLDVVLEDPHLHHPTLLHQPTIRRERPSHFDIKEHPSITK
jgi:hypothetical protein